MVQITVKELRSLLFRFDNQDMTIRDLRSTLFSYLDQNAVIVDDSMICKVINSDGSNGYIYTDKIESRNDKKEFHFTEGMRVKGTYSHLPFTGSIHHIDDLGFIFVNVDLPYNDNLPVGKALSSYGKPSNANDLNLLCSFKLSDKNIQPEKESQ